MLSSILHVVIIGPLLGLGIGPLAEVVFVACLAGVAEAGLTAFQDWDCSLGWWCLCLAIDSRQVTVCAHLQHALGEQILELVSHLLRLVHLTLHPQEL